MKYGWQPTVSIVFNRIRILIKFCQTSLKFLSKLTNSSEFATAFDTLYEISRDLVKFRDIYIEIGAKNYEFEQKMQDFVEKMQKKINEILLNF